MHFGEFTQIRLSKGAPPMHHQQQHQGESANDEAVTQVVPKLDLHETMNKSFNGNMMIKNSTEQRAPTMREVKPEARENGEVKI